MAEEPKRVEQSGTESTERKLGSRFVETRYDGKSGIVEFNIFVVTSDEPKLRVLGGGAFEERDLQCVAEELTQLMHDFALFDAQLEGYMQDVEEADTGNE